MEKLTQDDVAAIIFRRADGKLATHVVWETAAAVIAKLNAAHPLQYAPTEPGAPQSDEEWNEFCRACGNDPEAWGWARIRLNCILAKRDTAQPAESLVDHCAKVSEQVNQMPAWKKGSAINERPLMVDSAQDDWNDQHGHRTEILPLIGGEFAGKTPPIRPSPWPTWAPRPFQS